MRLLVHTARLPNPRAKIAGYRGPDAFNVTRRGGGAAADPFAPSDDLLDAGLACKRLAKRKRGAPIGSTEEERLDFAFAWYRELYVEEMRASYRRRRAAWRELLGRGRVVLCCWCGTATRCHRRVLAELLVAVGRRHGVEVVDGGELATGGA